MSLTARFMAESQANIVVMFREMFAVDVECRILLAIEPDATYSLEIGVCQRGTSNWLRVKTALPSDVDGNRKAVRELTSLLRRLFDTPNRPLTP